MLGFCVTAAPYPEGQPMVAALEDTNITLSCSESKSLPPAKSVWQRGTKQEPIVPSSKYIVFEQGPILSLTIVNATKEDQGVYFCLSENVLAAKELEVILTIRCKYSTLLLLSRALKHLAFKMSYCIVLNVWTCLFAASADKSGVIVGVFISILILAAGIAVGYFLYTHRDRICLGTHVLFMLLKLSDEIFSNLCCAWWEINFYFSFSYILQV